VTYVRKRIHAVSLWVVSVLKKNNDQNFLGIFDYPKGIGIIRKR